MQVHTTRLVRVTCPCCGTSQGWELAFTEGEALVHVLRCATCQRRFAVEVTLAVHETIHTSRLQLPSGQVRDALAEVETLEEPDEIAF